MDNLLHDSDTCSMKREGIKIIFILKEPMESQINYSEDSHTPKSKQW